MYKDNHKQLFNVLGRGWGEKEKDEGGEEVRRDLSEGGKGEKK